MRLFEDLKKLVEAHGEDGVIKALSEIIEHPTLKVDLPYALNNMEHYNRTEQKNDGTCARCKLPLHGETVQRDDDHILHMACWNLQMRDEGNIPLSEVRREK